MYLRCSIDQSLGKGGGGQAQGNGTGGQSPERAAKDLGQERGVGGQAQGTGVEGQGRVSGVDALIPWRGGEGQGLGKGEGGIEEGGTPGMVTSAISLLCEGNHSKMNLLGCTSKFFWLLCRLQHWIGLDTHCWD